MAIFNSYVSLPEGTPYQSIFHWIHVVSPGDSPVSHFSARHPDGHAHGLGFEPRRRVGHNQISQLAIWLVVSSGIPTPLKNMSSSVGIMTLLNGNLLKNVPNHLPVIHFVHPLILDEYFTHLKLAASTGDDSPKPKHHCSEGEQWGGYSLPVYIYMYIDDYMYVNIYIYMICISGIHLWPNGISIQKETHLSFFKAPNQCVFLRISLVQWNHPPGKSNEIFQRLVGDLSHKSGRFKVRSVIKTARLFPHVLQNDWIKYVLKGCFCGKGFKISLSEWCFLADSSNEPLVSGSVLNLKKSTKIRARTDQIDQIFHQSIHTTYLCSSVENQAQITVAPGSSDIVLRELVQPQVLSQMDSNGGLDDNIGEIHGEI